MADLEEEFEKLITELTTSDDTINMLEDEISHIRSQVSVNIKNANISNETLNKIYDNLCREKQDLHKCRIDLQALLDSNEVQQIQNIREKCQQRQNKLEHIMLFDSWFEQVFTLQRCLQASQQFLNKLEYWHANENLDRALLLLDEMGPLKERLFPPPVVHWNLAEDFDLVMNKLITDTDLMQEKYIFELIQLFKKYTAVECQQHTFQWNFLTNLSMQQYEDFIKCLVTQKDHFNHYFTNLFEQLNEHLLKEIIEKNSNKSSTFVKSEQNVKQHDYDVHCDQIQLCIISDDNSHTHSNQTDWLTKVKLLLEQVIQLVTVNRTLTFSTELLQLIGVNWCEQIFRTVIECHFEQLIPRSESQFDQFMSALDMGHQLEAHMQTVGLMATEECSTVWQNYVHNIKSHFLDKITQDFIIRTKRLLKGDLTDVVSTEEVVLQDDICSNDTPRLPPLKISSFMVEIKNLLQEMSAQFTASSAQMKLLLTETFANVCELYVHITPFLFKLNIERDPQQNALFHNNCLFFAWLIECVVQAKSHKPALESLNEFVPILRNLASQVFLNQMQYQEMVLLSFIKNDMFVKSLETIADEIPSTDLKISSQAHFELRLCINNCLKHLNALHTAFVGVLPAKICGKAFNTLISSFLSEFLGYLLKLNDISSLGASHLSHELDYFSQELKLFLADSDSLVSKWMKMNEINFILKSSLLEIVNRWADGKGLLANYLTADEVRHLIKALFQNNDRRSNALAKIK